MTKKTAYCIFTFIIFFLSTGCIPESTPYIGPSIDEKNNYFIIAMKSRRCMFKILQPKWDEGRGMMNGSWCCQTVYTGFRMKSMTFDIGFTDHNWQVWRGHKEGDYKVFNWKDLFSNISYSDIQNGNKLFVIVVEMISKYQGRELMEIKGKKDSFWLPFSDPRAIELIKKSENKDNIIISGEEFNSLMDGLPCMDPNLCM